MTGLRLNQRAPVAWWRYWVNWHRLGADRRASQRSLSRRCVGDCHGRIDHGTVGAMRTTASDRFRIGSKPEELTSEHIAPDEALRLSGFQLWAMTDSLRLGADMRQRADGFVRSTRIGPAGPFLRLTPLPDIARPHVYSSKTPAYFWLAGMRQNDILHGKRRSSQAPRCRVRRSRTGLQKRRLRIVDHERLPRTRARGRRRATYSGPPVAELDRAVLG
jgi:hypothetical protein